MHILDTDTLTHLHAGHPRVIQQLRELADSDVGITIITKIEVLQGRYDYLLKAATGLELLRRFPAKTIPTSRVFLPPFGVAAPVT